MAAEDSTELLPVMGGGEASFDNAMRGYDRRQVDEYVARLEADLLDYKSERDLALSVSAERAAQLANTLAHIESLEQSLARAGQAIDSRNVAEHVAHRLNAAQAEAAGILQAARNSAVQQELAAQAQVDVILGTASAEANRLTETARSEAEAERLQAAADIERTTAAAAQRVAEAEQKLAQARMQSVAELDAARTEAGSLLLIATTERDRLDAAAAQARQSADETSARTRQQAEEDFEITLRARRTTAQAQAEQELAATQQRIDAMLAQANEQVAALQRHRNDLHQQLVDLQQRLGSVIAETAP